MIQIPDADRKRLNDMFGPQVASGEELKSIVGPLHAATPEDISEAVGVLVSTHMWSSDPTPTSGWRVYARPDHWVISVVRA